MYAYYSVMISRSVHLCYLSDSSTEYSQCSSSASHSQELKNLSKLLLVEKYGLDVRGKYF